MIAHKKPRTERGFGNFAMIDHRFSMMPETCRLTARSLYEPITTEA